VELRAAVQAHRGRTQRVRVGPAVFQAGHGAAAEGGRARAAAGSLLEGGRIRGLNGGGQGRLASTR